MTKQVHWKGDFSNAPKSGVAIIENGMARITWEDGTTMVAPEFTMSPRYGWTVSELEAA